MKNKLEHLFGTLEPEKIKDFLDEMFEAWLPDCFESSVHIQEKHIVKRLLSEIVTKLYNDYNFKSHEFDTTHAGDASANN